MIYWIYNGVEHVTAPQFAEICGVALSTVHYWCRKGMPYIAVEKIYMIPEKDAKKWVKKNAPRVKK